MRGAPPQGHVTSAGRGRGYVHGTHLSLKVCPICSQMNSRQAADRGHCGWCAYSPDLDDAAPVETSQERQQQR